MYNIVLEKQVQKFLLKHKWAHIIISFYEILNKLKMDPFHNDLDIKSMVWLKNTYRIRVWKYRILYEVLENNISISVFRIDSRWAVYK